jgi:two-component system OmpR family response regulator
MKVLIVEDDDQVAGFLAEALAKWGHESVRASTAKEADGFFFERDEFDLVLLDLMLPDGPGYLLIPSFKTAAPKTTIITMTGHNSRELEAETRQRGVDFYMEKPVELGQLKQLIDHRAEKTGRAA